MEGGKKNLLKKTWEKKLCDATRKCRNIQCRRGLSERIFRLSECNAQKIYRGGVLGTPDFLRSPLPENITIHTQKESPLMVIFNSEAHVGIITHTSSRPTLSHAHAPKVSKLFGLYADQGNL